MITSSIPNPVSLSSTLSSVTPIILRNQYDSIFFIFYYNFARGINNFISYIIRRAFSLHVTGNIYMRKIFVNNYYFTFIWFLLNTLKYHKCRVISTDKLLQIVHALTLCYYYSIFRFFLDITNHRGGDHKKNLNDPFLY